MKIENGMYVRTPYGIAKVVDIDRETCSVYVDKCLQLIDETRIPYEDIIGEPSFEAIDLIEQGDIVNGHYIEENNGYVLKTLDIDEVNSSFGRIYYVEISQSEIREILTHEQYESGIYVMKGE